MFKNHFIEKIVIKLYSIIFKKKYKTLLDEINSINLEEIQEKYKNDKEFSLSYKYNK